MKKGILSRILLCGLAASMMMTAAGCASKEAEPAGTIAVISKAQNLEFWTVVDKGAKDAGLEIGYNVICSAPENEQQVGAQIDLVNEAVKSKVDAIVVAPINGSDLNKALASASSAGIKVITLSTMTNDGNYHYIGSDNIAAGSIAGREARKLLTESKKVGIIALTESSVSFLERVEGFKSALIPAAAVSEETDEAAAKEDKAEIVGIKYCEADTAKAKQQALELIESYPDIELIYGVNQNSTIGICQAVEEKGLAEKVKVVGFNAAQEEIDYIKNKILNGVVVQNPYNMGYIGVRNAAKLIEGDEVTYNIDTGVTYINLDNVGDESVHQLLYPLEDTTADENAE